MDQVVFRPLRDLSRVKTSKPLEDGAKVTAGRLYHPPSDKSSILSLLVEPEGEPPYLYADLDLDNTLTDGERFPLTMTEEDNPYILQATLRLPIKGMIFQTFPVVVQYFKDVEWDELKEGERLLLQSKDAQARGRVDIAGRKTLVGYAFNAQSRKVSTTKGWLGIQIASLLNVPMLKRKPWSFMSAVTICQLNELTLRKTRL